MTIRQLEKMTREELYEIQNNSIAILKYFEYNINEDLNIQKLSDAVDTATTEEECHEAYIMCVSALNDKAEEMFYENKKLTVNELIKIIK